MSYFPRNEFAESGKHGASLDIKKGGLYARLFVIEIVGDGIYDVPHIKLLPCGEIVDKYIQVMNERFEGAAVEKYIIMPNHIHLIIDVEEENGGGMSQAPSPTNATIPKFVSLLKRYCSHELGGNIFQRSYHDHIVRSEQDYLKIWTYIDSNHQKWEDDIFFL